MSRSVSVRRRGAVALSELVSGVIAPVVAHRGATATTLVTAWAEIVGPAIAAYSQPLKVVWPRGSDGRTGGVLHVGAGGPRAVLLQHELDQLIERINAYLGYGAIVRIRVVQRPTPDGSAPPPPTKTRLDAAEEARLAGTVAPIDNEALRAALARLGRGVLGDDGED